MAQAVLASTKKGSVPGEAQVIRGWDFDEGNEMDGILGAMLNTGIQATALGRAFAEVNRMVCPCATSPSSSSPFLPS